MEKCLHTHTNIRIYHVHKRRNTYKNILTHIWINKRKHKYILIHTHTHTDSHMHMNTHMNNCIETCMNERTRKVYIHTRTNTWYKKRSLFAYMSTQNKTNTFAATLLKRNNESISTCVIFNSFT